VVTRRSWLNGHHDEAQRAIDAIVQAPADMKKDKAQTEAVLKKYLKTDNQSDLDATYDYYVNHVFPPLPTVSAGQFKDILDNSKDEKVKSFDPNKAIDASFVKSAEERGLQKG